MSTKQQEILYAAVQLFARHGYHAVGIDTIISTACVAKKTFYKYFPSKKDLVIAVLDNQTVFWLDSLRSFVKKKRAPISRIKAVFDWHAQWFNSPNFTGNLFNMAISEFRYLEPEIKKHSLRQKHLLIKLITEILELLLEREAALCVARQCVLLLDGAIAQVLVERGLLAMRDAWLAVEMLIDANLSSGVLTKD